ncbi:hypothetical protein [Halotia branconii]|uniref:NAD/NADP transhydrogenase beta subunit n=1 Tax=Halotia branconii CENA392 TaxID=1539056 RepID=A0AAJ6PCR7_9CYAN|nr:hypothetical protein [Halotia branconii]WGV29071.1 hypothetical protein QI031_31420 [Halotia branconii CENA392]
MLSKNYLFAQSQFAGADLLEQASKTADFIAQGFNDLWDETIRGDVYIAMCKVGVLFAVATLTFFMVEWTKKMLNGEEQRAYSEFIWVLIVIVLLANNGKVLGESTLGIRNYINNTNKYVLERTAQGVDLRAAYQKAMGVEAVRGAIGKEIGKCETSSLTPEESVKCLEDAKNRLQRDYPSYFTGSSGPFSWIIQKIDRIIQAPIEAINGGANPLQVILSPFSAYIGSSVIEIVSIVLIGLNGAYQWAIELTMLLTALIGPLAVGGSLLPYGGKAIFTWLTGYFAVGMAKLCFNVISGLAGQLIATSRADQPLFFLFTIGIFAPFLATGLAAGGGLAVLQQINKASETYSAIAIDASKAVFTRGRSLASKF